ncbi:MAG: hypothetical protein A2808_01170 [Candidatus Moranbacteria bacterium RIFCSPHIGHO2_01_FULL_55_24]|nr:MAG: hypothetical protein A2808_01170 [Candidatus Moranbacteria bacterium RIFCSPHIGHO2_01_FULL_55_24]
MLMKWILKNKKGVWVALALIVLLGAGLRLYALGENSFVADEFLDINGSYGYFQTGEWQAWDFNYGKPAEMNINEARDERAFLYKWQVASLFHFLPPTEANARLVSVFWGILSILVVFGTARWYSGKTEIGLIAAFLFAVSISAIIFDRRLRMYAMFFPLYLLFSTFAFAAIERAYKGKIRALQVGWERLGIHLPFALLALVFGFLSFQVHQLTASIVPVLAVYLLARAWQAYREGDKRNKYAVFLGLGALAFFALLLFFPSVLSGTTKELNFFDDHYGYIGYVLSDYAHPLLGILVMLLGARFFLRKPGRNQEGFWIILSLLVPLALAIWVWKRNAGPQYIFFVQSFAIILSAAGIYGIWEFVKLNLSDYAKAPFIALLLGFLLLPNYGYFFEENTTYHETSSGSNPNYRKVFGYFKKNKAEGEVLITRNFRNYYFSGAKVPVYDFGGELSEERFSRTELESILEKHPHGWVIVSTNDYDYISKDAEALIKERMERVSHSEVRGPIEVYRW